MKPSHLSQAVRSGRQIWQKVPSPGRVSVCCQIWHPSPSRRAYSTDENSPQWTRHTLSSSPNTLSAPDNVNQPSGYKKKHTAYIAFGSNEGDRVENIEQACKLMEKKLIKIKRTSSLWETEPMYVLTQGKFLNGVCEVSKDWPHVLTLGLVSCSLRLLRILLDKLSDVNRWKLDSELYLFSIVFRVLREIWAG